MCENNDHLFGHRGQVGQKYNMTSYYIILEIFTWITNVNIEILEIEHGV